MIQITDKHNCCGCEACAQVCPKSCISMERDAEGFWYPVVDSQLCIDCSLCEKVCPFLADLTPKQPLQTYAASNPDKQERYNSSSGGIFSMLAREVLTNGGVVYGAAFDQNWNVHHIAIEKDEDLHLIQGSKYVQSFLGNCYCNVKKELSNKRIVLFSGTACQIAGLNQYLRKKYENLITVDVVCHGVPSPRVWSSYLSQLCSGDKTAISKISFRDKLNGWENYDFVIKYCQKEFRQSKNKNIYMQGFLNNIYLRPSCYQCKVKAGKCSSDITLGDFWGVWDIMPCVYDKRGTSLVLANTEKGLSLLNSISATMHHASYSDAIRSNPCIIHSSSEPKSRVFYWDRYSDDNVVDLIKTVVNGMKPTLFSRLVNRIKRVLG